MQQTENIKGKHEQDKARARTEAGAADDLRDGVVVDVDSVDAGGQAAARPVASSNGAGSAAGSDVRSDPAADIATGTAGAPMAGGQDVCVEAGTAISSNGRETEALHDVSLRVAKPSSSDPNESSAPAKVLSLAGARARRARLAIRSREHLPSAPELHDLDLRGVDFDRFTPEAREHYWFNVNKYARHLFVSACDLSAQECEHPYSPICVHHVREAELKRMALQSSRTGTHAFGLLFFMDALQILAAAACGALATQPQMFSSAGAVPLMICMGLTVAVFLFREAVAARAGRF